MAGSTLADVFNANPALQRRFFFLARRFVAGERVDEALAAVRSLNARGCTASLDFLGEDVTREEEARHNAAVYREMVSRIAGEQLGANISVKLSAIGLSISEDLAWKQLATIIDAARPHEMFVRLDMEGSSTVDSTYRLLNRALEVDEHVGPVIQAYLHRAPSDVDRMIEQRVRVRLCKGAYKEPETTAIRRMPLIRQAFMAMAERLLTQGKYPGIATHDQYLIDAVRAFVERNHVDRDAFEFQMLYGIRTEAQTALVREGYRMRVYVPFGTHWAGYFYRRLAERRENVLFVLSNLFKR